MATKKGSWIQGAIKKPGALRKSLGVKEGEKIPKAKLAAAAKKDGKITKADILKGRGVIKRKGGTVKKK